MRKSGTVKWFNQAKGFGFILTDGGGADVFVHISALTKEGVTALGEGQRVPFDLAQDRGKTMATEIQLDGPAPAVPAVYLNFPWIQENWDKIMNHKDPISEFKKEFGG